MEKITILWADDEIELLKPQLLFLEKKGYEVIQVTNGHDALDECESNKAIDIVFLDEGMPGITGLETLARLKATNPNISPSPPPVTVKTLMSNSLSLTVMCQDAELYKFRRGKLVRGRSNRLPKRPVLIITTALQHCYITTLTFPLPGSSELQSSRRLGTALTGVRTRYSTRTFGTRLQ